MPRSKKILDTNVLIEAWKRFCPQHRAETLDEGDAQACASHLIDLFRSDAIVTPIYIGFVVSASNTAQLRLYQHFLGSFDVVDGGRILPEDWKEAIRLAERVPRDGRPRQLGDCLIRAIATRLNYDVETRDRGFPPRRPTR